MASTSLIAFLIILSTFVYCFWGNGFAEASKSLAAASSESLSDGQSLLRAIVAWNISKFPTWVGDDPCQPKWDYVDCNHDHRVTYLNLSNKGLSGPIPQEIGNLIYLETLDLNNPRNSSPPWNQITGNLSALQSLTNLQSLNLSFNNVNLSSFPPVVLTLKKLKHLRIDNNYIRGQIPKEISNLTQLEYLYLGNNSMSGPLPKEFGNLINLKELSLWNNNLNSIIPAEFGKLINLEYLNLHDCNLYGGLPPEIGSLINMKNISLYKNSLTGPIPESWGKLKHLYNLWLYDNYLTKSFPMWIKEIPTLTNLSLDWNYFYGPLPSFEGVKVNIVTIQCNFFSGSLPTTPPQLTFNYTGNCFNNKNYESDAKIKCRSKAYFDCDEFEPVSNGECPICPPRQVIEDSETCVCTLDKGGGSKIKDGGSKIKVIVGFIVGVGSFLFLLALVLWMWARYHRRPIQPPSRYYGRYFEAQGSIREFWEGPEGVVHFNLEDLARATGNFNSQHEIGIGGFGKVFYAVLDGRDVAIKVAHSSSIQSSSGFRNEVLLLSRLHHKNLVHLMGFCEDDGIQILVYEYMPNGNLNMLLFKNNVALDWLKRLDIAIGVAQGLEYLHSFADPPVIHRDVKPSNILLDGNLVAKLSDFGLSKVAPESETHFATRPAGTLGYIDPQYILRNELTTASDVYSFGIVLLEVISGQKSIDNTRMDECNLVEWVKLKLDSDGLTGIVDPRLGNRFPFHIYQDILRVAMDCASFKSEDRPSMKAVVAILNACRWSVSQHLYELPQEQTEEDIYAIQRSDQQGLIEPSTTVGSSNTFSVSFLLPR